MSFWTKKPQQESSYGGAVKLGSRQRRLLSETVHIEEELVPTFVRPVLQVVAAMLVLFGLWAGLTHLEEVARAPGEIIPSGQNKVVQHLDGGAIASINVEEHMLVQQGQLLLRLDGTQALADLRQMEARLVSLRLRDERLRAFAESRKPDFGSLAGDYTDLLANQKEIYRTQSDTRTSTISILDRQIEQRLRRILQLQQLLASAKEQQVLTGELTNMRDDLGSRKLVNRSVILETRRAKVTADSEVERLTREIEVVNQELGEVRNRRVDTLNQLRRDALAEMGAVGAEMAEVEETIQRLQAKVDRLDVLAPNRGYVQDLKVQTVGQVVQPGALLMQIVPDDAPLEAMIRISPKDIAYVKVGQPVKLRVTSFDYARFGFARGTLSKVTASSITEAVDGKPYYRAWVKLTQPYVGDEPGRYPLQTGMSVEAEVLTGQKTLIAYLTKPVTDVISRSFRER